jgi:hypothetical protein
MQSATAPVSASSSPPTTQPTQQLKESEVPPAVDEKKESPSDDGYTNEAQMHQMPPIPVNGGMPPQQVYVNTAMVHHGVPALEAQFHSLGMNEVQGVGHHEAEGEENDEDQAVKLFVGQVRLLLNFLSLQVLMKDIIGIIVLVASALICLTQFFF